MKKIWTPLALAIILFGCSGHQEGQRVAEAAKKPEPLTVQTAAAETRLVDKGIFVTGSLSPDESVNLSAEVAGRVTAIHADFGQRVHKGEVLAEINPQEYQIAVERSQAALAQALARVGLTRDQETTPPESTVPWRFGLHDRDPGLQALLSSAAADCRTYARSKRSRSITFDHAEAKSRTNFCCAWSAA